jgi:ADP-ribose pyrophosphatase
MKPWRLLSQRPGPSGYLTVVTNRYEMPDGVEADWDVVTGADPVAILALTRDREIVLARQYRPGPDQVLDELPGGVIDAGESPAEAAARELREETGYVGRIETIGSMWLAAKATQRHWAALAVDCERQGGPSFGDGEYCETRLVSLTEFREHLRSGQLTDVDIGYRCLDHAGLL